MNILSPKIKQNGAPLRATLEDQPICNESEDLFGREQFAKTLVSNIYVHCQDTHPCVVIALDGQWGEGKTSLLNRIHSLMSEKISPKTNTPTKDDPIIQVRYNPWLCTNQESLLVDFFQHLLKGLGKDRKIRKKVLNYAKRIISPLSQVTSILPISSPVIFLKGFFSLVKGLTPNSLEEKSLCDLKEEIDDAIYESNKHLIVYIDDLDRLDKEECHAVIKLIKQTADFRNTIYFVAMDMDHVAHSIKQFYGRNEQHFFGTNYLQKIIQQPIRVPKFQQIHLFNYIKKKLFTEFIDKIVETAEPSLQILLENEVAESKSKVLELTLPLIDTPRQVIQWVNNLKFTLPHLLLTNEVNLTDFLLLSFLKVSFPDIYEKIRSGKRWLLTKGEGTEEYRKAVYEDVENNESRKKNKEKTRTDFKEKLLKTVSDIEEKKDRMRLLFTELLHDFFNDSDERSLEKSVSNKRLCTEEYYNKYFVYDTPEDVISEYTMQTFLSSLKESGTSAQEYLNKLLENYAIEEIVYKFREVKLLYAQRRINKEDIFQLLLLLSQTQNSYDIKGYRNLLEINKNFLSFTYDMIKELYSAIQVDKCKKEEVENFMIELAQKSAFMFLTVLLANDLSDRQEPDELIFRHSGCKIMMPTWIERYKTESKESIFKFDGICSSKLLKAWKETEKEDFETYVNENLYTDFEKAKVFCCDNFYSTSWGEYSAFSASLDLKKLSIFLKEGLENDENAVKAEERKRINDFIRRANQYLTQNPS